VSPNGTFIVSGSGDRSVHVWNTDDGQAKFQPLLEHTGGVAAVVVSPDGRLIASASTDHTVMLWDADTGMRVGKLDGHVEEVLTVAFSPDSLWLASGSEDKTVCVWDVAARSMATFGPLLCAQMIRSVAFSPNGQLLAAADVGGYVHFWQTGTNTLARGPLQVCAGKIFSIAFSHNSRHIAAGGADPKIRIWNISDEGEPLVLVGHEKTIWSIAYSPESIYIASASLDKTVRLWDALTGEMRAEFTGHCAWVLSIAFMPDQGLLPVIVSGCSNGTIRVCEGRKARDIQWPDISSSPLDRLGGATLMDDGWLVEPSIRNGSARYDGEERRDQILLWVPEPYRGRLTLPPCSLFISSERVELTAIDAGDGYLWGDQWTRCWNDTAGLGE